MKLGIEGVLPIIDTHKFHCISIIRSNSKFLGNINSYMPIWFHSKIVSS